MDPRGAKGEWEDRENIRKMSNKYLEGYKLYITVNFSILFKKRSRTERSTKETEVLFLGLFGDRYNAISGV